jgi:hypothetical protein
MPRPREYNALLANPPLFANRQHVCQRLAGMMHRRLEIDDGYGRVSRKRIQHRIGAFFLPVFQRRKRSHADSYAISLEHAHKLRHVFGLIGVHHGAVAMLQRPTRSARLEHDGIAG